MPEPCRSCERRKIDWGAVAAKPFALSGDAARIDPACALSADHALLAGTHCKAEQAAPDFVYRQNSAAPARLAELVRWSTGRE
jgi:pyrroloquinoline quinone biosynthesis protein E